MPLNDIKSLITKNHQWKSSEYNKRISLGKKSIKRLNENEGEILHFFYENQMLNIDMWLPEN